MATKKDLVEAYSFSRRRLVTAFVSGAPGGREVEPSRPGRTIVGGIALAVLVAAGGAVAGILGSHTSVDWTKPALVSDKDTFADYVVLPTDDSGGATTPVLRPVANITSAMLLLGPGLTHEVVGSGDIAGQRRGAPIGILQAPASPPDSSSLVQSGWTACTGQNVDAKSLGTKVTVSVAPAVTPAPSAPMVFSVKGKLYLVAEAQGGLTSPRAYAYAVPDDRNTDNLLQDVAHVTRRSAVEVPTSWIDLFPTGPALSRAGFAVPSQGTPVSYASQLSGLSGRQPPKVGDYFFVSADHSSARVLLADGVSRLDPFATRVYIDTHKGSVRHLADQDTDLGGVAPPPPYDPDLWPGDIPGTPVTGESCAVLESSPGQVPSVVLATTTGGAASAVDVARNQVDATVDSGHGAVVYSGGFGSADFSSGATQPFLVDDRGYAYALDGTAHDQLGYADVAQVVVPDTWLALFKQGVPLSVDAARCPPTSGDQAKPCGG